MEIDNVFNSSDFYWEGETNFVNLVEQNQCPNMKVLEIGCYDGSTTRKYIDIVKKNNGHVYVIDTFMGTVQHPVYPVISPHVYGEHNIGLYDKFIKIFKPYSDMMTVLRGLSTDMISMIPDNSMDIIFIDADHRYNSVKKDIEISLPKVKSGKILCGHDCETFGYINTYSPEELELDFSRGHHPGVSQAVYEKFGITSLKGNVWSVVIL